ncbi:ATP-binding cassette sub-family C member 5-like isoform X2 [Oratosquilla oratoria]|uniref:ATP-binding cassette sub-family C member 5-like isoform X2 n=1 Tax=Oratosquilla oratoria TaxID=337810 RepID=UPI003F765B2E
MESLKEVWAMHKWLSSGSLRLEGVDGGQQVNGRGGTLASPARDYKGSALSPEETFRLRDEDEDPLDHITLEHKESRLCRSKYSNALKHLLPFRPSGKDKRLLPSNEAGLFSFFSLTWMSKVMWKAFRKGLTPDDLWTLQHEDGAEVSTARLERLWEDEKRRAGPDGEPELYNAVWKFVRTRVWVSVVISILQNVLQFLGPSVVLKLILDYLDNPTIDYGYATWVVVVLAAVNLVRMASFNIMFVIGTHTATRVIGGIQGVIFRKALKLRTGGEKLSAQIVNFSNNDMERLFEASISCVFLTAMPVMFGLSFIYAIYVIGVWALLGLGVYLLCYPIMGGIARLQSKIRVETVKVTDKRVTLMGEILNSMRLIKMYSWEDPFAKKISGIRNEEMKKHKKGALLQSVSSTVVPTISILATIITLLGYTISGYPLTAAQAFTIYSVFLSLQFSVGVLPFTIRSIAEGRVSLKRIQKLLEIPEHVKNTNGMMNNNLAIQIKDATFAWEVHNVDFKERRIQSQRRKNTKVKGNGEVNGEVVKPELQKCKGAEERNSANQEEQKVKLIETLFTINLSVERNKLIGICGSVGAGKSSLVSALCGDMTVQKGTVKVNGRLAVVTQQAWIYNETFRENILMGHKFEKDKYEMVINVCSLKSDLQLLANGDMTEIGERGINLSGGQKQRLNLARALYSDRDIFLLDDPLSAVDTKVAKHIFNHCIKTALKDRTVLLITHAPHNGRIVEKGTHAQLIAMEGDYYDMVGPGRSSITAEEPVDSPPPETKEENKQEETEERDGKLIKAETKYEGSVNREVYLTFIKVSGGWCMAIIILLAIIIFTLARLFNGVWLKIWLDEGDGKREERVFNMTEHIMEYEKDELDGYITDHPMLWMYQLVYGLSVIIMLATGVVKGIGVTFRVLAGSSQLHNDMFASVLRAPMSFLDTTPTGRVLNRFSRDLDELDVRVPFFMEFVLQGILFVLAQLVLTVYLYPIFLAPLAVIAVLFIILDVFLNAGVRELKRLDNTLKSPVIQFIGSTISGLTVIRTYDREGLFTRRFYANVDRHSAALLVFRLSNRWFTFRMDLMTIIVTVAMAIISVYTKGVVSTAAAGLALSTINGICGYVPFLMRMKSEFSSRITSAERIIEYAYGLPSEAPRENPALELPSPWPCGGAISMKEVKMRYREDLPLVLHGINAEIRAGEKVGIIGRTGAGKSSLMSTLLRMAELDSGSIIIDGIDISQVGLHTLRSAISVIPQDPVLFQGTIRYNLDPFDEHSDTKVWEALEQSHLKNLVQRQEYGLCTKVEAAGENFSIGERQLICLTRALLRNSKILLLDEATASVDVETDHLIQETIREAFARSTVMTIAHRLNTIASYDRVMVLEAGKVKEFDTPTVLMLREDSLFRDMMSAMGVTTVEQMMSLS